MISEENKQNKWDDCEDCIYFQEAEEEISTKHNSAIDIAFELHKFINECNICKGDNNKC